MVLLYTALVLPTVVGCARIEEPWVRDVGRLAQERSLSPAQEKGLRLRAALYQRDR